MDPEKRIKLVDRLLGTLQLFIGANAVAGGWGLVADPSGAAMGLQLKWLADSPFNSYFIPGLVLLVFIGSGNLLASAACFFHNKNIKSHTFFLGIFLVLFLAVEVWFLGLVNLSQLLLLVLGGIQIFMGITGYDLLGSDGEIYIKSSAGSKGTLV